MKILFNAYKAKYKSTSLASQTHIKMLGLGALHWHGSIQGVG